MCSSDLVVANITLVQRGAPDRLRGRAFTVIMSSNFVLLGFAMLAAGPLTDRYGARWIWGGSAVVLLVAAAAALTMTRRLEVETHAEPAEDGDEGEDGDGAASTAAGAVSH